MGFLKSLLLAVTAAGLTALALAAFAAEPVEGKDYVVISPAMSTDNPGKVEVTEFFWYGCPHCFHFEPTFNQWIKKQGKDVAIRFIPAPLNPAWTAGAKLYYALDILGAQEKLRNDIFVAIHNEHQLSPTDERGFVTWVGKKGVDTTKFSEALNSFSLQSKIRRAAQLTNESKIDGTPSVVVAGKYRIVEPAGMSPEYFMQVADALVAKARKESGK
ncbi:MAG TPA: thiol:disulfide interchange protein DsbA/DsbL [Rhodocyclaceae bacterium]|jgi:thiol:disulfide interchange protein DsbA|nr:thiol:disulfide interchange protein DsbA/DsbL [Rhodocyclaceae bacterium]